MKKRGVLLVMAVMITAMVTAQEKDAGEIFLSYTGRGHTTVLTVPRGALKLAASLQDNEEPEVKAFLEGLTSVKIMVAERPAEEGFYGKVLKDLSGSYEELMTVDKGDEQVKFLMRQEEGVIRELLLLTGEKSESALIIVRGAIRLDDLARLKADTGKGGGLAFLTRL